MSDTLMAEAADAVAATGSMAAAGPSCLAERPMTAAELEDYRDDVESKRLRSSNEIIYNNSSDHAAVLVEQLLLAARSSVKIVCHGLSPWSYGAPEALTAAMQFLSQNSEATIDIFTREIVECGGDNPFVTQLGHHPRVKIEILEVPTPFDFMVVDKTAYRYEPDHDLSKALACFRDPTTAERLDGVFEKVRTLVSRAMIPAQAA